MIDDKIIAERLRDECDMRRGLVDHKRLNQLISTIQRLIRESQPNREQVEKAYWKGGIDAIISLFNQEREWCEHIKWDTLSDVETPANHWCFQEKGKKDYKVPDNWNQCPVCPNAPRPEGS